MLKPISLRHPEICLNVPYVDVGLCLVDHHQKPTLVLGEWKICIVANKPWNVSSIFLRCTHFAPLNRNRPVAQIPQCPNPIHHNLLYCNINVHMWIHMWMKFAFQTLNNMYAGVPFTNIRRSRVGHGYAIIYVIHDVITELHEVMAWLSNYIQILRGCSHLFWLQKNQWKPE